MPVYFRLGCHYDTSIGYIDPSEGVPKTMRWRAPISALPIALTLMGATYAIGQNPVYELAAKPQSARVTIMALSDSSHSAAYAGNQEVYLADIELKRGSHQLAKLVDTYPSAATPIRRAILTERYPLRMQLVRNEDCDTTGQSFFLGDDDANLFDASSRKVLKDNAAVRIPCFNVMHNATRLGKMRIPPALAVQGSGVARENGV
jgi:hypothetical protein